MGSRGSQSDFAESPGLSLPDLLVRNTRYTPRNLLSHRGSCVFLGKDRVGALYATQSIALAQDLSMQMKKGIKQGKEEFQSPELLRSYTLALSAAFSIQS